MGTRGAVAFGSPAHWEGVYNHSDSQPTGLGAALWLALRNARSAAGGLAHLRTALMAAGDWAAFERGEAAPEPLELSSESADPMYIEWVYVIDVEGRRLHVLGHAQVDAPSGESPRYFYDLSGSFDLDADEPNWRACEVAHSRKHAGPLLEGIRARFGEEAYRAARRQILGD
jgi:hypothetical protein